MTTANERQVGGAHYQESGAHCPHCGHQLQHWDVVAMFNLGYLIGNATKYLFRLGKKGGVQQAIEDLDKAVHYIEKKKEELVASINTRPKNNGEPSTTAPPKGFSGEHTDL